MLQVEGLSRGEHSLSTLSAAIALLQPLKFMLTVLLIVISLYATLLYLTNPSYSSLEPPPLRHYIPFLGHVVSFGRDQRAFFSWAKCVLVQHLHGFKLIVHSNKTKGQPFTMYVAGEKIYVFSRSEDIAQIMRMSKTLGITVADQKHFRENIIGFDAEDADKVASLRKEDIGVLNSHLLNTESLDVLTTKFMMMQDTILSNYGKTLQSTGEEVDAFDMVGELLLNSTAAAILGSETFVTYASGGTTLFSDYRKFLSEGFWARMMGLPAFFSTGAVAARERMKNCLENIVASSSRPDDVSDLIKDSIRVLHEEGGVSAHGTMSNIFDLTILGANLNSISMAYLTLLHIFTSPTLQMTIQVELTSLDYSKLSASQRAALFPAQTPHLRALFREVMRYHTTAWSAREVLETTTLSTSTRSYTLLKSSIVAMPSSLLHHNPTIHSSPATFDAARFLATDLGGKGTAATPKELRPFGGGASYCPGRLFAEKQILGFVAEMLSRFKFEIKGKVDIPRNADFFFVEKQRSVKVLVRSKREG